MYRVELVVVAVVAVVAGLMVSCLVAARAGRDRASMWWGLFGPVGWIIAAIHSLDHGPDGHTFTRRCRCGTIVSFALAAREARCAFCGSIVERDVE